MDFSNLCLFPMVYFTTTSVAYIILLGAVGMLMTTELEMKLKET
jgi:hypothetical protein